MAFDAMTRAGCRSRFFITPAGFLVAKLPAGTSVTKGWNTDGASFAAVRQEAARRVEAIFSPSLWRLARSAADAILIGVDVKDGNGTEPHGEASVLVDTQAQTVTAITGKTFPTTDQEVELIRNAAATSHVQRVQGEQVAVLVCHDLMTWSPRSKANRKRTRASVGTEMERAIRDGNPTLALHQAHTVSSTRTWSAAWAALLRSNQQTTTAATAFRFLTKEYQRPDAPLDQRLLAATGRGDVVDVVLGDRGTLDTFRSAK
jgi:hypothetical protein